MWRSKFLRSRAARATVRPVVAASADTPAFASPTLPPSENLRATSAAVAELVEGLDFVFDQVNYEEEPGDLLQLHLERLMDEASKYCNSSVRADVGEEWKCPEGSFTHKLVLSSSETAQLLLAACQCSSLVYDPMAQPGHDLRPVMSRAPSATGTEKAFSIWKMDSTKTLIVSVRGTASVADHMVNLNADPKRTSPLFELSNTPIPVLAHGGFMTCAKVLLPLLLDEIGRQVELDPKLSTVVLTGHSAGGAVSSLLFLHLMSRTPAKFASLKISLVTFGSAPVISSDLTEAIAKHSNVGFALAFVNEYDIVPRADRLYIRSLVNLYRSRYGLPSVAAGVRTGKDSDLVLSEPSSPATSSSDQQSSILRENWDLPSPTYQVIGEIVVLQLRVSRASTSHDESGTRALPSANVRATKITHTEFGGLLFCDLGVHKRKTYLQRMEMLNTSHERADHGSTSALDLPGPDEQTISNNAVTSTV
ncbi:Lipase class 3 [Paramyrothecium foliicola]|nr:Lipase class 3 [Paramyrothecium foliicola]